MPHDKPSDYLNLTRPHFLALPGQFRHPRLGAFKTGGIGSRPYAPGMPRVGILHVPVMETSAQAKRAGRDDTAERCAKYLADPPENKPGNRWYKPGVQKKGNVHACTDRDSLWLCLPIDSQCWGCANPNTAKESYEIEIAGLGDEKPEYWSGADARKKFVWAARAIIDAAQLVFDDRWREAIPPARRAVLRVDGSVKAPGWAQHRDVPIFSWREKRWVQPPENIRYGQHADICEGFPWPAFFAVLNEELKNA